MTMFFIQSVLLILIAFILGCILGCLFRQWFGKADATTVASGATAATAATAALATSERETKPESTKIEASTEKVPAQSESVNAQENVAETAALTTQVSPAASTEADSKPAAKKTAAKSTKTRKATAKPAAKKTSTRKGPAKTAATKPAGKDDLKRIRGIGRQNEARLNADGITQFAQIAKWTAKDQREIGERLAFPGRIEREEWVKQAKILAKGGDTDFSKRVKKGSVSTSKGKGDVGDLGKKPPTLKAPRKAGADNLTLIDGVGNAIENRLNDLGIFHFNQIAKWDPDHETWIGNMIGFPGRSQRENWVEEAKILAAGGTTEHAKRVESGKISTSRKSKPTEK